MKKKTKDRPRGPVCQRLRAIRIAVRIELAAEIIRRVRRAHPMRKLRLPAALEIARALEEEGALR